jgi:hypothetical protein
MSEQMQPFADFVREQGAELKSWWARLIQLAPVEFPCFNGQMRTSEP